MALPLGNGVYENWGESGMAETSLLTDNSTELYSNGNNQIQAWHETLVCEDSVDRSDGKREDQKSLRRLAQNREAARKSRLKKKARLLYCVEFDGDVVVEGGSNSGGLRPEKGVRKVVVVDRRVTSEEAYVQQLENGRLKLNQLEQELQRARQQGIFVASGCSADQSHPTSGNGGLVFDIEYARWLDEHQRQIIDLRSAVNSHMEDNELCRHVDGFMAHYEELFRLKGIGAKFDVFHILSGMWKTPAERIFMWLGGFRSSELLKMLGNHLEPLTDQQLMGICNLQQSSQEAEDALSQGMEALQQSLANSLSSGSLGPSSNGNVSEYMGQMALAMGKLATLENFLHQADLLRQQTLQQLHRILTTRQVARALLAISDYFTRLRALSSLWLARPRD